MHRDMFKIQDGVAIVEKLNCVTEASEYKYFAGIICLMSFAH